MKEYLKDIIGNEPYSFQERIADLLLNDGKNVILSVPTGAGKTWAAIAPFLYAKENQDSSFPNKMIYSSPLRTLTNSIFEDVSKEINAGSIQTGEYNDDKYFESDIIFSTIDQTLSNFLSFPLPLSQAQANINAGTIIGSYLVFDEFHLLDPKRSMATTIGMLKMLGNLTRCCIMTATLESKFMNDLKNQLNNYVIVTLDDFPEDKERIASLLPIENKKRLIIKDEVLSARRIADTHKAKTIAICNRVESAQKIYQELIRIKESHNNIKTIKLENIICLHSRFFDEDRKNKENKLKSLFGKHSDKDEQAILISTQVIEAGMDLSCDTMHTEISPINSFLQRAGRCARFANEKGDIYVYDILEQEEKIALETALTEEDKSEIFKINNKYLPYTKEESLNSFNELKKHKTLDGDIPKIMIENIALLSNEDWINQMRMTASGGFNIGKIRESWDTCEKNNYRDTIRDIQSVDVVLIDEDSVSEVNQFPYRFQSLSMYKWSLVGWLNKIEKGEGPIQLSPEDWLVMELKEADDMFLENDESVKYELQKIIPENFKNIPNLVFVNAQFMGYDDGFGLNWQYEDTFNNLSPDRKFKEEEKEFAPLKMDTFYQHNKGLLAVFEKEFLPKLDFTFAQLSQYLEMSDMTKDEFGRLIKLMIVLHDYGKLNDDWQNPMQKYQKLKSPNYQNEVLAHTDYKRDDENDVALGKQASLDKRPGHAGVGAYVIQDVIEDLYDNEILKSSISMAIARHHSSLSRSYPDFKISDRNYSEIRKLLMEIGFDIELEQSDYQGQVEGFETEWYGERILYFFFVRILRLCDQKATENLKKYYNF